MTQDQLYWYERGVHAGEILAAEVQGYKKAYFALLETIAKNEALLPRQIILQSKALDGWQPIETAPKYGNRIMLANDEGVWMGEYAAIQQPGFRSDATWSSAMLNYDHMKSRTKPIPTHWMPLPKPPEGT